jgi:tetratricopeptide (TPR) repeat protein
LRGTLIFLGITELRLGKFAAASKDLGEAVVLEPQQSEAWLNLLRADQAMGKFDETIANRAAGLFPEDAEIQFAIAESALDEIREIAKHASALGPEDEQFRFLTARKKGGELHDAPTSELMASYDRLAALVTRSFESVLRLSPDSASGHIAKGWLEEAQNHVDAAIAEYRQGGDHFAAGRLFAQNSRLPEAEQEFQAELERNPSNHLAMADLAEVYIQEDQMEKARPLIETLLKTYPRDAWAWLDLGKVQQRQEDWKSSATSFEKALAIDPSLAQAHYRLSISYRKSGQKEKAMAELKAFRDNQNTQGAH